MTKTKQQQLDLLYRAAEQYDLVAMARPVEDAALVGPEPIPQTLARVAGVNELAAGAIAGYLVGQVPALPWEPALRWGLALAEARRQGRAAPSHEETDKLLSVIRAA